MMRNETKDDLNDSIGNKAKVEPEADSENIGYRSGFDPFKKADLILAEKHRQARLVRRVEKAMKDPNSEKCECCGFPVYAEPFSLNCDLLALSELGSGFPLFFLYVKTIGVFLLLGIAIITIPCIVGNLEANNGFEWQNGKNSWVLQASVGNNGANMPIYPLWQCILHIIFMIILLILYHIAKKRFATKDREMNLLFTTAKDYTVHVYGLGEDIDEIEVKEFFESYGRFDGKRAKVVKINFPCKLKDYIDETRNYEEINEMIQLIENCQKENRPLPSPGCCKSKNNVDVSYLKMQVEQIDNDRKIFEEKLSDKTGKGLLIGQAFVTFDTQADARAVVLKYGQQFAYRSWSAIGKVFCGCCVDAKTTHKLKRQNISVEMANEPSDIFWENLEISFKHRLVNTIEAIIFTLLAVSVSFGMVYGMKYLGQQQEDESNSGNQSVTESFKSRILSIWPSIVIIMINTILGRSTRYFSSFERPHTATAYNTSLTIKLTIAMFVNTAVIAIVANYSWQNNWFNDGGLASDATYIIISNALVTPLLYLLSPSMCIHKYKVRKAEKAEYISQIDANLIMENPQVDIAQLYANVTKTILLTFFYAPLIPVAYLFSAVGILLEYWASKYLLIRRHGWPKKLSGELSETMVS